MDFGLIILLGIGFLFGIVVQRGFFCMYNGFAYMTVSKDYRIIKAVIWAFVFTLISFHVLQSFGLITFVPKPFFWLGSIVGAMVFSVGMILSGACIVGTPLRAASGRIVYWFGLLGMGFGGWLVTWGPLTNFRTNVLQNSTKVSIDGKTPTLENLLNIDRWIIVAILLLISAFLLFLINKKEKMRAASIPYNNSAADGKKGFKLWPPLLIGAAIAFVEVLAFLSGKSPAGLGGFIAGWATYFKSFYTFELPFAWPVAHVTGLLAGVFVSALVAKEFRVVWPKNIKQTVMVFFGGAFMGMGAVTAAGGCNVAHIISHMPQLSLGSFVSGLIIITLTPLLIKTFVMKGKI